MHGSRGDEGLTDGTYGVRHDDCTEAQIVRPLLMATASREPKGPHLPVFANPKPAQSFLQHASDPADPEVPESPFLLPSHLAPRT